MNNLQTIRLPLRTRANVLNELDIQAFLNLFGFRLYQPDGVPIPEVPELDPDVLPQFIDGTLLGSNLFNSDMTKCVKSSYVKDPVSATALDIGRRACAGIRNSDFTIDFATGLLSKAPFPDIPNGDNVILQFMLQSQIHQFQTPGDTVVLTDFDWEMSLGNLQLQIAEEHGIVVEDRRLLAIQITLPNNEQYGGQVWAMKNAMDSVDIPYWLIGYPGLPNQDLQNLRSLLYIYLCLSYGRVETTVENDLTIVSLWLPVLDLDPDTPVEQGKFMTRRLVRDRIITAAHLGITDLWMAL